MFFTNQKHRSAKIANFVFAVPFRIKQTDGVCNRENVILLSPTVYFTFYQHHMVQIKKETVNIWEYKVGINAITANFVCF